jgi:ClpP class serine protease
MNPGSAGREFGTSLVITPSGEAGPIGVRAMHQDLSKALELKGIKITHISAGKYKTEGAPTEPLGEKARAYMQQRVNEYYDMFVAAVLAGATSRNRK